ncbi:hypothetical protein [Marinicrinis lubricantis]|uniref:Spore coat protein n=1 Tax=Marinicrinis lubricantis TaxID=2086470 RepID=A0ABW1IT95_9BACL
MQQIMPQHVMQQTQAGQGMTVKEMLYITDCMRNEELLTKLCVQAAMQSKNQQMSGLFHQYAHESFNEFNDLLGMLQQDIPFQ